MSDAGEAEIRPPARACEGVFRAIFEQTAVGVALVVSKTGAFVRINQRYAEILGYTIAEVEQLTLQEITHPEDFQPDLDNMQRLLSGEIREFSVEHRCYRKDGSIVWVNLTVSPMWKVGEEPDYHIAIVEDITERKHSEEAFRQSQEYYRALVEGLPDIVLRYDREGRHLFVSENVEEAVDLSASQFLGKTDRELGFAEDLCELWEKAIGRVFESGLSYETEFTFESRTGPQTRNWRLVPERDDRGRVRSVLSISRDVTEYRRAEQDYQTLFREMHNGFALHEIICDDQDRPMDYRFLAVNPAFERLTGLKSEDLLGKTVLEVMPNTERHWIETYGRVALDGEPIRFENYSEELDKHYLVTAFRPAPRKFACVFDDITKHKRAEQAIQEARDYAENLIQTANAIVVVLDTEGNIKVFNDIAEKITGYTFEELRGRNWFETLVPRDQYPEVWVEFERLQQGGIPAEFENPIVTKAGEERHIVWQNSELFHSGQLDGTVSFGTDITDRKRAEKALQESEERYRLAQRLSDVGTWEWNVASDDVFWSDEVLAMWGLEPGKFGGTYAEVAQRIHPDDLSRWRENVRACVEDGKEYNIEYRIVWPDGAIRWVAAYGDADRGGDGRARRVMGVIMDISERKCAERERNELIAKLEAQNAELEQFTYTVSHDLKSPLITIKGYIGMLSEDLLEMDTHAVQSDLSRISLAADKMGSLLDDLLELSRIGRMVNPPESVSLVELAKEVLEILEGRLKGNGVNVKLSSDLPVVFSDRTRLFEVLQNLIENAVKYLGDEPRPRIVIGARHDGNETVCYVRDNGIGIEPRFHDKIFGLFDQLDPKVEGTGIGLALVKRIVEVLGGRIWVESEGKGCGSTFCFTVPSQAAS
jgi:PAS domain S-box-containing protein